MAFTFTDSTKVLIEAQDIVKVTLLEAVIPGDLLSYYNTDNDYTVQIADESDEQRAELIAIDAGAAGDEITACLRSVWETRDTVGVGGVVTEVYFADEADFLGAPLFLGEDGKASSTVGTTYRQVIGKLLSRKRLVLETKPTEMYSDQYYAPGAIHDWDSADITMTNSPGKLLVESTWAVAGRTGRPFGVTLTTNVRLVGYANALKGYVDCDLTGGSIGLLSGVNGEIRLPNGAGRGAYFGLESEVVFQVSSSISHVGHGATAGWLYLGAAGAGLAEFNTYGVFMALSGLTPGTGELLSLDFHTLKCDVVVAATHYAKYLVLSIAENYISHSFSVIANDGRMLKLTGSWATPATPDGEGAVNIAVTVTGQTVGEANLASHWINLGNGSEITLWSHIHTDGFYDSGATLTGAHLAWAKYAAKLDSDPQEHFIMDLNMQGANSGIDAIYNVNNPALALGYVATTAGGAIGSIPFFSTGGTKKYIMLYSTPA